MGWVPFVLEAADYHVKKARQRVGSDDLLPSEFFRRQVYVTYWFEDLDEWHVQKIGAENVLFETDFPHRTCLEDDAIRDVVTRKFANLDSGVQEKILWRNAEALYAGSLRYWDHQTKAAKSS